MKDYRRKLEVTVPGRWYLALTIALGVVAMTSGNNVLYLIESLLLAGLILSGILSERVIAAIEVDWLRGRATAGARFPDRFRVTNTRKFAIFCVEIGEFRDGKMISHVYIPRLQGRASVTLPSRATAGARGVHRWSSIAVATSFPLGFARKLLFIEAPGERVIWPEAPRRLKRADSFISAQSARQGAGEISDGEIRPYDFMDDSRMIVWTLSAKGQGPMVRIRRRDQGRNQVTLDLRAAPGPDFEASVSRAAAPFHESDDSVEATLMILSRAGARKFRGRRPCLDALAISDAEGSA